MNEPRRLVRRWPALLCGAVGVLVIALLLVAAVMERELHRLGRDDLMLSAIVIAVYVAAIASAGVVGTSLAVRRAGIAVGWSFVALAWFLALYVALDLYARVGAVADPGSLPGADTAAHLVDPLFVSFFTCVAVALHLTPTGRPLTRRWGLAAVVTVAAAVVAYVCGVLGDRPIDPPFAQVPNPIAIDGFGGLLEVAMQLGSTLAAIGLLVGAASVMVRFRRATGSERQQLWWLALAAVPLPLFVVIVFAFRNGDDQAPLLLATAGWIVVIPVATGLCISRYHLFDVERIVNRAYTYVALSAVVVATYVVVVVISGDMLSGRAGSSTISAVLGTLAAVSVALPARRFIQNALDRRFNRRRFDAQRVIEDHLRDPVPGRTIENVLRTALGDPALTVQYWVEGRDEWVTGDGRASASGPEVVEVYRKLVPVARVSFDVTKVTSQLADAAARLALPELDNARLRAAISLQLVEVNDSRARIAAAQLEERRRIERNLHDGAQQRLLALSFELTAAQMNGDPERLRAAVATGIEQAHLAVTELRDLANGLHPSVLSDGGLAAALDELVSRTPGLVTARCTESRLAPDVEAAAWFVVCEAVSNSLKHAHASIVCVEIDDLDDWVDVTVRDDGRGGADPTGKGIEGIRDRTEAAHGSLSVQSRPGGGTIVMARIPCGQ